MRNSDLYLNKLFIYKISNLFLFFSNDAPTFMYFPITKTTSKWIINKFWYLPTFYFAWYVVKIDFFSIKCSLKFFSSFYGSLNDMLLTRETSKPRKFLRILYIVIKCIWVEKLWIENSRNWWGFIYQPITLVCRNDVPF